MHIRLFFFVNQSYHVGNHTKDSRSVDYPYLLHNHVQKQESSRYLRAINCCKHKTNRPRKPVSDKSLKKECTKDCELEDAFG